MATIGLKNLYYATISSDTASGTTYSTPKRIVGAIQVDINPTVNTSTLNADDAPFYAATSMSEISVTMETADIPLADVAALLGHDYDSSTGEMTSSAGDVAPYVAIMAESEKADGDIRFFKLYKGRFADGQETINTKGDSIEYTTPQMTGTFVCRLSDGRWKQVVDADAASAAATRTAWFASV